ncbi:MAG TPA: HAD family hydrolase [Armatimonadota bacterium]
MSRRHRAIFLDRDGTLILDVGYPRDPRQVQLLPGVLDGLTALRDAGFLLVMISNQSGVGRGLISEHEMAQVHARVTKLFAGHGITFAGAYYCPHAPTESCTCRKPQPGLLQTAAQALQIDLSRSFMVGDKPSDVMAGWHAGCRSALLAGEKSVAQPGELAPGVPDITAPDLWAASQWILNVSAEESRCTANT